MPTYDYRCNHCQSEWERQLPIAERNDPLTQACPACFSLASPDDAVIERHFPTAPGTPTHVGDSISKRTPEAFKDVLRNIKSAHRGSTINV
jgi:putative FmdB family regulatory protein